MRDARCALEECSSPAVKKICYGDFAILTCKEHEDTLRSRFEISHQCVERSKTCDTSCITYPT